MLPNLYKLVLLTFFSTAPFALFPQLLINTDSIPAGQPLPAEWRGHNHSANSLVSWYSNPDYEREYGKLHVGIERWPGGNSGNSYRWQTELKYPNRFNLKNVAAYMDRFDTRLQMVVNFGNGSPAETAHLLRLCNSNLPRYRQLRDSLLDHPDALDVKIWEIGNESTDAWTFAWSWLGYQKKIHFRSGEPSLKLSEKKVDSMYYYGGEFYRQGWVEIIGGLDLQTAILGDLHFYANARASDTVKAEFPALDTGDPSAIRIFRTSGFDLSWASTLSSPGTLYDSIAQLHNLLSANEFDYSSEKIFLHPNGGIKSNDLILIEYLSTGHSGAFEFRDSIKANDPASQVGYTVNISPELESIPGFIDDFRQSPPDFMIKHPYATRITKPLLDSAYYAEAAYAAQFKVQQLIDFREEWSQRKSDWNLAQAPGLGISEWNIALCDECPADHPLDGIAGALFVADFWGRMIEKAIQDSVDLSVFNHFGLVASGYNFIHLLHPNKKFSVSPEGIAVQMLMQAIAEGYFDVKVQQMPTLTILWEGGNSKEIDALSVYGGVSAGRDRIQLLIINRDDRNAHQLEWPIPDSWVCDSLLIETFTGSMSDSQTSHMIQRQAFSDTLLSLSIPRYSLLRLELKLAFPVGGIRDETAEQMSLQLYPNPAGDRLTLVSGEELERVELYDLSGHLLLQSAAQGRHFELPLNDRPGGMYLLRIRTEKGTATRTFIRQ